MKQVIKYILTVISLLIIFSLIVKISFLCYNSKICPFQPLDVASVLWHGLCMDVSISVIISLFTWVVISIAVFSPKFPLRAVLAPWYMVLSFLLGFIYWGDIMLYEVWGFKLNYAVFSYMSSPGEGTASMTWWYIISRVLLVVGTMTLLGGGLVWATPKHLNI